MKESAIAYLGCSVTVPFKTARRFSVSLPLRPRSGYGRFARAVRRELEVTMRWSRPPLWLALLLAACVADPIGLRAERFPEPRSAAAPSASDLTELRELKEVLWPRAYREGDVALLDRILATEFQMIDSEGEWSNKAEELDHVAKRRSIYRSFRFEIRRLEVFENGTAVIAGRGVVTGPETDPEGGYEYQSSNVLIRRDGRWQAISSHVSGVRERRAADLER